MDYGYEGAGREEIHRARRLRRKPTWAEEKLWEQLSRRQVLGFKFLRQHPIGRSIILDFYCLEARLAIEVDGEVHQNPAQAERDTGRTHTLNTLGIRVLRFSNRQVLFEPIEVIEQIRTALQVPTPLPPFGGTSQG